ncbi:hypothetical protein JMUB3935_2726 [Leptotrichia trevisanii]|uniref:DUF4825 domain-containing protein n=1 Tax=Leptotrichia trevisanii TaxID=109328 RepID=A0A510KV89_9FUSO|nr:DUF4825 domain-containing protein [Leptotrichia trevisanii]BBM46464.1 hypothetical protein JMUB3870_2614 [Leptotrichia trevisanii]BBM53715.1 hypothetical protein JMUB3935_2726 [Leptotrichia trevisanii]
MKNKKLKIIISLIVCVIFTACGKSQNSNKNIYEYKTKYVGDNSKVINILSNLKYPKETSYNSVQILSEKEPYGILVKLNTNSGKISEKNDFLKNTVVMFALIENLSFVKYTDVSDDKIIAEFTRDEIDNYLKAEVNKNTKEIGMNKKEFIKYLNE